MVFSMKAVEAASAFASASDSDADPNNRERDKTINTTTKIINFENFAIFK